MAKPKTFHQTLELPSAFSVMDDYIGKHKSKLTEQVVASIEFAINNDLPTVEVFNFQGSEFMVVLSSSTFKENLDNIMAYYISTEQYEFCARVTNVQKLLNNEKTNEQKKRHKPKNSPKSKNKGYDSDQDC
jgi:hypothetical protein